MTHEMSGATTATGSDREAQVDREQMPAVRKELCPPFFLTHHPDLCKVQKHDPAPRMGRRTPRMTVVQAARRLEKTALLVNSKEGGIALRNQICALGSDQHRSSLVP